MPITIKIHRGTHQIGGTITEIKTDKSRIFIDFGQDLNKDPAVNRDAQMIDMIRNNPPDAVLFTHYHGDHVGLMKYIPEQVPMYIGKLARRVIITIHRNLQNNRFIPEEERMEHKALLDNIFIDYNKPENEKRLKNYTDGESFIVGKGEDIRVTPILVDHSACDAYMFLIEVDGKCILHTGDFRCHGVLGEGLVAKVANRIGERIVSVLITEGTMLSRPGDEILTEKKMQEKAELLLSKNRHAFLFCSSTNAESLASFNRAALKNDIRMFVSSYVSEQISMYKKYLGNMEVSGAKENKYFDFIGTYELDYSNEINKKLGMTQPEYMRKNGFLVVVNKYSKNLIKRFQDTNPMMIYSMWDGYINNLKPDTYDKDIAETVNLCTSYHSEETGEHYELLHTSGHASRLDIEDLIDKIKPTEAVIPIHTEKPGEFKEICENRCQGEVVLLSDGEEYILKK